MTEQYQILLDQPHPNATFIKLKLNRTASSWAYFRDPNFMAKVPKDLEFTNLTCELREIPLLHWRYLTPMPLTAKMWIWVEEALA